MAGSSYRIADRGGAGSVRNKSPGFVSFERWCGPSPQPHERMRLFIALNLPDDEKERIQGAVEPLRDANLPVRWVAPMNYHVTLKFLGDVPPEQAKRIGHTLDEVASKTEPFNLEVEGFGAFPTIRRPKVIWMGVNASPALRCLKQDVEWALTDLGFDRETKAFHPHLTLGRANANGGAGVFRGLDEMTASLSYKGDFDVETVDLMRSRLSKDGPTYSVFTASVLGAATDD